MLELHHLCFETDYLLFFDQFTIEVMKLFAFHDLELPLLLLVQDELQETTHLLVESEWQKLVDVDISSHDQVLQVSQGIGYFFEIVMHLLVHLFELGQGHVGLIDNSQSLL